MSASMTRYTEEIRLRLQQMLRTAFGEQIAEALSDGAVTEILVNPDGSLWIETAAHGRVRAGSHILSSEAERIIRLVASASPAVVHEDAPILSTELPGGGERFEGLLPPIALAPAFAIRKPARTIYTLEDYSAAGMLTASGADIIREAIRMRSNILVVGGTGSGKTTFVNALLAEVARSGDRVILLEDTRELQCAAPDCVALRTMPPKVTLGDLVRSSLRLRPDRIIVGEVRGPEALDMLKSWNTGHPGGISTLHANSPVGALYRLEQLIQEAVPVVPRALIGEAVDLIVFLSGRGSARRVGSITRVGGYDRESAYAIDTCYEADDTGPGTKKAVPQHTLNGCTLVLLAACFITFWLSGTPASFAAGTGMPWEEPLDKIVNSIQGPVARVIAVIIITLTGLSLAFGDTSGGFRRLIQIVFGLTIAFTSASFFLGFFQFAGGAVIR